MTATTTYAGRPGYEVVREVRRVAAPAAAGAALGLVSFLVAVLLAPERALLSYLAAFAYGVSIALGALFMVMIAHVTGAKWFVVVRRVAEAVSGTLPLFALLLLPVLLGVGELYPWVPPLEALPEHAVENIRRKRGWLNVPFFVVRSVVYVGVWAALAWLLGRWSRRQDRDPEAAPTGRAVRLSAIGLIAAGLAASFAAVDWLMSLSPTWASSVFGAYWFAGAMYGGLAALTLVTRALQRAGILGEEVAKGHYYALGRLMLVFTALWAYMAFSQGFLIYIADLPREVTWYLERLEGGWGILLLVLVMGHFFIPLAALLSYDLKHDGDRLAVVAAWMLLMHYLDTFWLVVPALRGEQGPLHWVDPATLVLVIGAAIAFGAWALRGERAVPWRDPGLKASLEYRRE